MYHYRLNLMHELVKPEIAKDFEFGLLLSGKLSATHILDA